MTKLQIISDKNKKSSKIKKLLIKKINQNNFKKENLVIVIGGDGFMLQTLKKNKNLKKKFYGINSGNYGFLMNKFSSKNIIKNLTKAHMISISPLEMIVKTKKGEFEVEPINFKDRRELHRKEIKVYWDNKLDTDAYYELLDWVMNKAFKNPEEALGTFKDEETDDILSAIYQEYKGVSKKKS